MDGEDGESGESGEIGENPPLLGRIWLPGSEAFAQQVAEGTNKSIGLVLVVGTAQFSLTDEKRPSTGEDPSTGRTGGSSPKGTEGFAKPREGETEEDETV